MSREWRDYTYFWEHAEREAAIKAWKALVAKLRRKGLDQFGCPLKEAAQE